MVDRLPSKQYVPVRFWYLVPKAVSGSVKPENKKRRNYGSKEKEEGLLSLWCIGYRPYHKAQGWEGGYGNYLELRW